MNLGAKGEHRTDINDWGFGVNAFFFRFVATKSTAAAAGALRPWECRKKPINMQILE